ncbi:hypothetical protein BRD00_04960 [Halobacteriales archaeon QS_8_69_26]|nr:MAG: hypothetical protein BRD00_04960 [Halobacteriales archaeon QS_8_69_26]
MGLLEVVGVLAAVVGALIAVATVVFVGRERLWAALRDPWPRLDAIAPYLVTLGVVLLFRRLALRYGPEFSWVVGVNLTGTIYAVEGTFIATLQSYGSPAVTMALSFAYLYGYAFLLLFPFVAYFALDEPDHLRELTAAATLNYGLGLVCYILFVVYGPRNVILDQAPPLLYDLYPQSQLLTREVNRNVNAFPSLHTSLSVTVAAMAIRTRDHYRRFAPVAAVAAGLVVLSTMYLAIHWAMDVLGGVVLGLVAYYGGVYAPATSASDLYAWLHADSAGRTRPPQ